MNPHSAADAYKRQSIENAPPLKVVQMLYEAALRHLDRALAADPAGPEPEFVDSLTRADEIVVELRLALDESAAPELAASLQQLYFFVEDRINVGLASRERGPLEEAHAVLRKLREGWASIEMEPGAALPPVSPGTAA